MARFIEARVIQKVDTEANWMANPLPLYQGEVAFVSDKYNFKLNTTTTPKTFAQLEYYYKGDIIGGVLPTDDLASKPEGVYRATISGTYGGVVVKEGYYTLLRKDNGVWKLESEVEMPMQDVSGLVKKEDIVNDLTVGGVDKVASAETIKMLDNDINQMSGKVIGKNLIDPEYITTGKRIGGITDNYHIINDTLGILTGYIKVKPGTQYSRIGGYGSGILVEKLGDTVPVRVVSGVIFTPSIGENYFLMNISIEGDVEMINSTMVWDSSLTTNETYEPYWSERKIKDSSLPEGLIREDDWNKIATIVKSKNLFDKNAIQNGMWLNPTILESFGTRITSDYIAVTEGKSYKIGNLPVSTTRQVGGFAKRGDKVPLWYVDSKVNSPVGSFTVPTGLGINFIVFNIATIAPSQYLDNIQLEEGLITTSYVPFSEKLMIREEVLPEITPPSDTDTELMYSEAMRDMKKTNEANQNENLSRLRTIRGIKNSDSGQIEFTVNNDTGSDISNVLLPIYLHRGDNEITPHERHIFLSDNSQSLSDVRFLDSEGNFMNFYCPSKGNYELLVDDRIKDFVWADNDGILLMCDRTNIFKSTDNLETVELIKAGYMAGINQLGDIFYKTSETGTQILYKSTKASNYTDEIAVLDTGFPTRFSPMAFKMTDEGVMFVGCYQDNYNALIWRSVNNGNSWTLSLNQSSRQHVHSIVIDRNTSPNTVYANIDGNIIAANTDSQMACYRTTNSGVSWERLSLPFLTDYGVLYTGDDFTIGGGEGAVKGTPTIWKRNKATGDISIKVDTLQNSPKSYTNKNAILISGGGHSFNGTPKIYRSIDKGETFKEIFTAPFRNTSVMNYSWRYGSSEEALLPSGSSEEQNFITCNYIHVGNYNLRYFEGGDHYMGLFYVKVPLLKSGINNFSVGYGYASEDIQEQVFERPELPIFEMGMNEKTPYIFDNIDNNYKVSPGTFDITDGARMGMYIPKLQSENEKGAIRGKVFEIDEPILLNSKTISFWLKMGSIAYATTPRPLFGGDDFQVSRINNYLEVIWGGVRSVSTKKVFPNNEERLYCHHSFVFKISSVDIYMNGFFVESIPTGTPYHLSKILGFNPDLTINHHDFMAGFKVFDKEFTQEDVLEAYYGGIIV